MQAKKRAKPVKFGKAAKEKVQKEPEKVEKVDEASEEKVEEEKKPVENEAEVSENLHLGKGVEAHYTSRVETLDLTAAYDSDSASDADSGSDADKKEDEGSPIVEVEEVKEPLEEEVEEKVEESTDSVTEKEEAPSNKSEEPTTQVSEDESFENKDGAFFNVPPDQYDNKKSMLPYFFKVMLLTFLFGLVFFGGIYYAVSNKINLLSFVTAPTPTPTEEPEPTPTEEPVDLSAHSIRVLNGTETSGLAATARTELEDAGFNVESVGNAESSDFEQTEIAAKENVDKAFLDKLKAELEKNYAVGEVTTLSSGDTDVVVTLGGAK